MRVGTSEFSDYYGANHKDHPHACGDKKLEIIDVTESKGSSPCVWGQASLAITTALIIRIIPMRVGTRSAWDNALWINKDHPHACGDKRTSSVIATA